MAVERVPMHNYSGYMGNDVAVSLLWFFIPCMGTSEVCAADHSTNLRDSNPAAMYAIPHAYAVRTVG